MKKNIGKTDRLLRLALALIVLAFAGWQGSWIALVIGLFILYEALAGWCVIYQLIGKNTCPISKE